MELDKMEQHVSKQLDNINEWCKTENHHMSKSIWAAIRQSLRTMYCTVETDTADDVFNHSLSVFKNPGFWSGYQP
jgi:hypothetical protein